jgi:hypothetical protein
MFNKSTKVIFLAALLASQNDAFFSSASAVITDASLEAQISRAAQAAAAARAEIQHDPAQTAQKIVEEYLIYAEEMAEAAQDPESHKNSLDDLKSQIFSKFEELKDDQKNEVKKILRKREIQVAGDYDTPIEILVRAKNNVAKQKRELELAFQARKNDVNKARKNPIILVTNFDQLWKSVENLSKFWEADLFSEPTVRSLTRMMTKNAYGGKWKKDQNVRALKNEVSKFGQEIKDLARDAAQALSHQSHAEDSLAQEGSKFQKFGEKGQEIFALQNKFLELKKRGAPNLRAEMSPQKQANAFLAAKSFDLLQGLSKKESAKWLENYGKIHYGQIAQKITELMSTASEEAQQQLSYLMIAASDFKKQASQEYLLRKQKKENFVQTQKVMKFVSGNDKRKPVETRAKFDKRIKAEKAAEAEERRVIEQRRQEVADQKLKQGFVKPSQNWFPFLKTQARIGVEAQ